jgi:hypothetical protein
MAKGHKNASTPTTRVKVDGDMWRVWCPECNKAFYPKRSDATYCSPKCRMHAQRAPQRLINTLLFLGDLAFKVGEIRKQYKSNRKVYLALETLKNVIEWNLKQFDNEAKQAKDEEFLKNS